MSLPADMMTTEELIKLVLARCQFGIVTIRRPRVMQDDDEEYLDPSDPRFAMMTYFGGEDEEGVDTAVALATAKECCKQCMELLAEADPIEDDDDDAGALL